MYDGIKVWVMLPCERLPEGKGRDTEGDICETTLFGLLLPLLLPLLFRLFPSAVFMGSTVVGVGDTKYKPEKIYYLKLVTNS